MELKEPGSMTFSFLVGQTEVLEGIAAGLPLEESLDKLARLIQGQLPGTRCLVMRLDENGERLRFAGGPDFPPEFAQTMNEIVVGPESPCAARAAYHRRLHVTTNVAADVSLQTYHQFAREHEVAATWSLPILDVRGIVLGAVTVCHRQPTEPPNPEELETLRLAAHLASIAIERSQQVRTLVRHEEKWYALFEHSLDAILILDNQRRFVDANPAACEMFGTDFVNIFGQDINVFVRPLPQPDLPDTAHRWEKFLRDGIDAKECSIHRPDGIRRFVSFRAVANFQPGLHFCAARDITEQRLAGEALRRTEQLYRSLIETTGTGYLVADADGRVLNANAEYVHLAGRSDLAAIQGHDPAEWVAAHDRERYAAEMARCLETGNLRNLEVDFCHPHGYTVPVEINTTVVPTDEGTRLLTLCHDITGRLQTRRELQTAHRELESRVERRTAELARANEQIRSRARQQEAVAELGRRALAGTSISALTHSAAESVVDILGVELSAVLEHADPQSDQLILRANAGWEVPELGQPFASTDPTGLAGYAFRRTEPIVYDDLATERRFRPPARMVAEGIRSGITVQIPGDPTPFGLISGQTRRPRHFTPDDTFFLQSLANVLAAAVERHRAEDIIRQAQQGAVQANNAKIEFLSRMSHELRTPLNAILGFSQLLEIEQLSDNQSESVEQISRAGRHLLELVNEVLDISRIDSGNIALAPEPLAVHEILREALDLIRPLADARRIALIPGPGRHNEDIFVLADRQRLRQVLLNLLSNAVKYNREGGSVTLDGSPTPDGKHVRLTVQDTGVGIKPEALARLYTPFDRLGAENTDVEGSGMGLALSKKLVESQNGVLGLESTVGVGTLFWVDLPPAAAPEEVSLPMIDALWTQGLFSDDPPAGSDEAAEPETMSTTILPPANVPVRPKQTVLHIEDNEPNRLLVEMLVARRSNVRLLTASRGNEGLELAKRHRPSLILLDLHLPDTTGESVLQSLRADDATRDTPVVMVSADATAIRRSQAYDSGANDFLTKPFNVGQFFKVLDQYLSAAR